MIPKFRVWLPDIDQMLRVKALVFEKDKTRCVCGYSFDFYLEDENATIMQSTGILDKNSREIFEGDVVRQVRTQPTTENEVIIGVVTMIEGAWLIMNDNEQLASELWSETDENEIIGNIYENKEFLEVINEKRK
ncbi:YopX family protein [Streptococcus pneumoniae]|uniref:YopX family protein n=1 Tax=Streptococcus pneumoniae TaxID=1313 RepID=UPI00061BF2C7|nr:YopX family protein [Streptococcus pneumoniae]AZF89521.1 hypothetical protein 33888_00028 [Streptococcus phage 33888]CIS17023.1 phage protein [Streptococcus pneumoniae]